MRDAKHSSIAKGLICSILSFTVILSLLSTTAFAVDGSNTGDTGTSTEQGSGTTDGSGNTGPGGDQQPPVDPNPQPPEKPADPPSLPSCNLKDTTYSSSQLDISVKNNKNLKLEYILNTIGSSVSGSDWKSASDNTIQVNKEGSYQFYYKVTDEETGLSTQSKKYTIYFDRTSPKSPTIHDEVSKYDQCVYVTIEAREDNGSPISGIYYRIDGGKWKSYSNHIELTDEGDYRIEAYSVDECGNESAISKDTVEVDYSDLLSVPSVTKTSSSSSDKISYKIDNYRKYFTYYYQFVAHGAKVNSDNWVKITDGSISVSEHGEWDLYIKVEYENKEVKGRVATCKLDKKAPEIIEAYPERANSSSRNISIVVNAKDSLSSKLRYSFDGGKNWQSSNSKSYSSKATIKVFDIQVKDDSDNIAYLPYGFNIYNEDNKYQAEKDSNFIPVEGITFNEYARNNGYVVGTGGNKFAPDRKVTRAEFATMLYRVLNFDNSIKESKVTYKDVPQDFWAYEYIMEIQKYGLIETSSRNFEPTKTVTRQEAAATINKLLDIEGIKFSDAGFKDVTSTKYKEAINNVNALGIMTGYGSSLFGPEDVLTRAQMITILNRVINITDKASEVGKTYEDVPVGYWAYDFIFAASV